MTKKIGVLVIHGIGEQKEDFADGLIEEVNDRLGTSAAAVSWQPVWWAPLAQSAEADLLERLSRGSDLDYRRLRRFVVHFLGDAVAYQRVPGESDHPGLYVSIHALITEKLRALRNTLPVDAGGAPLPLVVIAHSLGGHIMSNYIWDQQRPAEGRPPNSDDPFMRTESLAGIVTFGCNIPLFALALPRMIPIAFPGKAVSETQRQAAQWLNLYDPDDILGFPLAPLGPEYKRTVTDRSVNVGALFTSWNPLSHNEYWTDNDVTEPIAKLLAGLL